MIGGKMVDSKEINRAIAIQKGWKAIKYHTWESGSIYPKIAYWVYDPNGKFHPVPEYAKYDPDLALDAVIPNCDKLTLARQIVEREYCSTNRMGDDQVLGIMREHGWHWNDQGWVSVDADGVWFVQRLIPDWGHDERE